MIYIFQIERRWVSFPYLFMQKRMPKAQLRVTHNKDSGSKGVWTPSHCENVKWKSQQHPEREHGLSARLCFPKSRLRFTERRKTAKGFKVSLFHRRQQKKVTQVSTDTNKSQAWFWVSGGFLLPPSPWQLFSQFIRDTFQTLWGADKVPHIRKLNTQQRGLNTLLPTSAWNKSFTFAPSTHSCLPGAERTQPVFEGTPSFSCGLI